MTWNGAGAWVIFSQARQVNFSRTCRITFHCRGMTSSVSVMSSPNLRSRGLPQQRQTVGPGSTTWSRGKRSGKGWRAGRLRVKATTLVVLATARSAAISSSVAELELLERQLHLIEQPHRAFRALAIELARQLCNLQLLMGDYGLIVGGFGLGHRQFRLDPGCPGRFLDPLRALLDHPRLQRGDVVAEVLGRRRHGPDYPTSLPPSLTQPQGESIGRSP